jgi:membrane-bound ClpP family serine protease
MLYLILIASGAAIVLALLAYFSRHRKRYPKRGSLLLTDGFVERKLDPVGTVLLNGELWRASSIHGRPIERQRRIRVLDVRGHLLLVDEV